MEITLLFTYLGEEWLASAVGIAITFFVFIMGLPALIFQTFFADAYRNIYNERLGQKWNRFFRIQIALICILFIQSNHKIYDIEERTINEWVMVLFIFCLVAYVLFEGYRHLTNNFNSTKNIEEQLSQKIADDALNYYKIHTLRICTHINL